MTTQILLMKMMKALDPSTDVDFLVQCRRFTTEVSQPKEATLDDTKVDEDVEYEMTLQILPVTALDPRSAS